MTQIIWLSFLLCTVLAENETISLLNLDIDNITWDDCSNGYFSTSFNILDNSNLESILGSSIDVHKREPENTGRELPGTSARNLEISISSDFSHFDFTDLWKSEHRSNEDSKIETVPITTGNSQLQELPRTDGENMHSSISSDPLHFVDLSHFREINDANTKEFENITDLVTAKNSELFVLQSASITDKKNYECPHIGCTMKTKSHQEYMAHRRTHPKPFIYECKVSGCVLTFNHPSSFYSHQKTHGPKLQCETCGKIFNCEKNLRSHKKRCTKAPLKENYECPHVGCTMKTKNYNEYIAHKKTHPKPFIYECRMPGCGRTFNHPSTFYGHQKTHGPKFQCGSCGKIFNCKSNLVFHKKRCAKIAYKDNYVCPHVGCTMKTKSRNEYIDHRKTHPKPFIYECKVSGCGLTFNYPSSFSFHQKAHGPKVQCEKCGKIFIYKGNLRSHRQRCMKTPRVKEEIHNSSIHWE
ncbi:Zinc finger, C2H2 type family protein [Brugia malayi]|uniref:Zinc finger, C2H2 type family protein n=2 Tax=Brugia malayi TaxID=6279 RepID=A0A4E9F3V8_BRUMA|nr:Zinc finger, C2H2 type family protein [Brugia malayi]VIO90775.1 Zinc finger, C2H2 type family protein [Brugia malayi]